LNGTGFSQELFTATPSQASELLWLDDETFAYLNGSALYSFSNHSEHLLDFPLGINAGSLQVVNGTLVFSAQVWADGNFSKVAEYDATWERRGDSGLVYDDLFIRHWDTWRTPGKVWTLGTVQLEKKRFVNLLNGTGLVSTLKAALTKTSAMDPIEFALSASHVAFVVKTPHLNAAKHTRTDIYTLPLHHAGRPVHLSPHSHGAISSVAFSDDGRVAWLEMAEDGYESDRNIVVVYEKGKRTRWTDKWDRSPSSVTWAGKGESLLLLAYHQGKELPYHLSHAGHLPTPLLFDGSTTSIHSISHNTFLFTRNSLTSPADSFLLELPNKDDSDKQPPSIHQLTNWSASYLDGRLEGLGGEEFWFKGAEGWDVMAWVIKPRGWDEKAERKYPLGE
jgi:dipeptidyl aminopeptidase/acylaminoacyl peptidase